MANPWDGDPQQLMNRKKALAASPFGNLDSGKDWQEQQLSQQEFELQQLVALGRIDPADARGVLETSSPNKMQMMMGLIGDNSQLTGGVFDTIGSVLNTIGGSYFTGALAKTATEYKLDDTRTSPVEAMEDFVSPVVTPFDAYEAGMGMLRGDQAPAERVAAQALDSYEHKLKTVAFGPANLFAYGMPFLGSFIKNYTNAYTSSRVLDEYDVYDTLAEWGFLRPIAPNKKEFWTANDPIDRLVGEAADLYDTDNNLLGEGASFRDRFLSSPNELTSGIVDSLSLAGKAAEYFGSTSTVKGAGFSGTPELVAAGFNAASKKAANYFWGEQGPTYELDGFGRFAAYMATDFAMDPSSFLNYGVAPGLVVKARGLAEGAQFARTGEAADKLIRLQKVTPDGKLTLRKEAMPFLRMAAMELAPKWAGEGKMPNGIPLIDSSVPTASVMQEAFDYTMDNFDRLKTVLAAHAEQATLSKLNVGPRFGVNKLSDLEQVVPGANPDLDAALLAAKEARKQIETLTPEKMVEEAQSFLHRDRYFISKDTSQRAKSLIARFRVGDWLIQKFDSSWKVEPDLVEMHQTAARKAQLELQDEIVRYTNEMGNLTDDELDLVPILAEQRWARQNGLPTSAAGAESYRPEVEKATNFILDEMEKIYELELKEGYRVYHVEDYITHKITMHPAARDFATNLVRKNGEEAVGSSNRFTQQRMIASISQFEDVFGEEIIEKNALRILAARKRASLEMISQNKVFKYASDKHALPKAAIDAAANGNLSGLVRAMARRDSYGMQELIPYEQIYLHSDSPLVEVGFKQGDAEHNAQVLEYLALPADETGRMSKEGEALFSRLGLPEAAKFHGKEYHGTTKLTGVIGEAEYTAPLVNKKSMPSKIRFNLTVERNQAGVFGASAPVPGSTPNGARGLRTTELEFSPAEVMRMLNDPTHMGWESVMYPRAGKKLDKRATAKFLLTANMFFKKHLNTSLGAMIPDLDQRLVEAAQELGEDAFEPEELTNLMSRLVNNSEVRKLVPQLPEWLMHHGRRQRERMGFITHLISPNKESIRQVYSLAVKTGFDQKLLHDYAEVVTGSRAIKTQQQADALIDSLSYLFRFKENLAPAPRGEQMWLGIGGEKLVKFRLVTPQKNSGNVLLRELLDGDGAIPTDPAKGLKEANSPTMEILDTGVENSQRTRTPLPEARQKEVMDSIDLQTKKHKEALRGMEIGFAPLAKSFHAKHAALAALPDERRLDETLNLWQQESDYLQSIIDSPEMGNATKLAGELRKKQSALAELRGRIKSETELRRGKDGKLRKRTVDEDAIYKKQMESVERRKKEMKKLEELLAVEQKAPYLHDKKKITAAELADAKSRFVSLRHSLSSSIEEGQKLRVKYQRTKATASTAEPKVTGGGVTDKLRTGKMVFTPDELLQMARDKVKAAKTPEELAAAEKSLLAARGRGSPNPDGIQGDKMRMSTVPLELDMYIPEGIARFMRDATKRDAFEGQSAALNRMVAGYDLLTKLYKTNSMLPWGGYWARNTFGSALNLVTSQGLSFLQPDRMSDFFSTWFYALYRYSDFPSLMGKSFDPEKMAVLGKKKIQFGLGREMTVEELVDGMRTSGVFTGQIDQNMLTTVEFNRLPNWMKQAMGGMAGAGFGGGAGAAAGAVADQVMGTEEGETRMISWASAAGAFAGGVLGGRKLKTAGVPIKSAAGATRLLQSSWMPILRNGEMVTEAPLRALLYMNVMKETGSGHAAQQAMMRHLNDWSHLSVFERRILRRLFPFYQWTKFATTRSLGNILEEPGRVNKIFTTFNDWNKAHDYDPEDVPDWYHEKMLLMSDKIRDDQGRVLGQQIVSGFGAMYEDPADLLSFMVRDHPNVDTAGELMEYTGGMMNELAGKLMARGPMGVTTLFDFISDRDSFTGKQISTSAQEVSYFQRGEKWSDAPGWLQVMVGYQPATADTTERVNPYLAWALGEVTISRFIALMRDVGKMDEEGRKKLDGNALARSLIGANAYYYDAETKKYFVNKGKIDAIAQLINSVGGQRASINYSDINKTDATVGRRGGTRRRPKGRL